MWDLPVDFYIVVHIPEVPHLQTKIRTSLIHALHVLTILNNKVVPNHRD